MNKQTGWQLILAVLGLSTLLVAGAVDLVFYRMQLVAHSTFKPIPLGAFSAGTLLVAIFIVAVCWLAVRMPPPRGWRARSCFCRGPPPLTSPPSGL